MPRFVGFCLICCAFLAVAACGGSKKTVASKSNSRPAPSKISTPVTRPKPAPVEEEPTAIEPFAKTAPSAGLAFLESERFSPVLEEAQRQGKPVFVVFTASWCAPCKVMEEEVFSQEPTYSYLNANFINYKVDFDSPNGKTVASIYEVKTLPTVLFVSPQGVVLARKVGMATHSSLMEMGSTALKQR